MTETRKLLNDIQWHFILLFLAIPLLGNSSQWLLDQTSATREILGGLKIENYKNSIR